MSAERLHSVRDEIDVAAEDRRPPVLRRNALANPAKYRETTLLRRKQHFLRAYRDRDLERTHDSPPAHDRVPCGRFVAHGFAADALSRRVRHLADDHLERFSL